MTVQPNPQAISRRYTRHRRPFSIIGILLGLLLGGAGSFYFTQTISPLEQANTDPSQLSAEDRADYMVAVALAYTSNGDLNAAMSRLLTLRLPGDPIQAMADTACQLATTGYVNNTSGLNAVRAMAQFYQLQGRAGCADSVIGSAGAQPTALVQIELPTTTPTLPPPETKTPTPPAEAATPLPVTPTPLVVVPTAIPQNNFELLGVDTFCNAEQSGQIQVLVYELNGSTGVPGQEIRARWQGGESRFFTGLKPERGAGYADFTMQEDQGGYLIDMPGQSEPLGEALLPVPCTADGGERAVISYRVIFRAFE